MLFRSKEFEDAKNEVCDEMRNILSIAERKPDDFNAMDLTSVLDAREMDFNDSYYVSFCKLNNFILVTDDKDMQSTSLDITILTA